MSESDYTCPICGEPIRLDALDGVQVEKVENHLGFGEEAEPVWSAAGLAHARCTVRMSPRYRVVDSTG